MSIRVLAAIPALFLCLGYSLAQTVEPPGPRGGEAVAPIQPPSDVPRPQRGDQVRGLDFLFEALKIAPDA